jgi:hypothetical protein
MGTIRPFRVAKYRCAFYVPNSRGFQLGAVLAVSGPGRPLEDNMRCSRIAVAGAIAGLAMLGSAGSAFALAPMIADSGRAGDIVLLSDDKLCGTTSATATSTAFTAPVKLAVDGDHLAGQATISATATVGEHKINVACGNGKELEGTITVMGATPTAASTAGLGGSQSADAALLAAGGAVLAGAAATGLVAVRRRTGDAA